VNEFKKEMQAQGLWDSVTVVQASEFGRTLRFNGLGTDHAWGGNTFITGGSVKGGRIFGQFPKRLDNKDPQHLRSGRWAPTTSWDSVWHGVAQWFGVKDSEMSSVLPNLKNFPVGSLLDKSTMFK